MLAQEAEHSVSFSYYDGNVWAQDSLLVTIIHRSFWDGTTAKVWPHSMLGFSSREGTGKVLLRFLENRDDSYLPRLKGNPQLSVQS